MKKSLWTISSAANACFFKMRNMTLKWYSFVYRNCNLTHCIWFNYCRDVVRWGKNVGSANTRTKRRAGAAVYNRASSLETLVSILGPCFSFIACQIDKCIMIYSGGCTNGKLSKGRKTLLFSVHQPPLFAYFYLVIASSSLLVLTYWPIML